MDNYIKALRLDAADSQNNHDKYIRASERRKTIEEIKKELKKSYPTGWSSKPMEESEILMTYRSFCRILDKIEGKTND